ncbi:hypothetical protein BT93_I0476 [Corymbia citriodora subsp. variegata]|nr:hypothetical protein BT93_I0476 [Corymbia citriodora subsp. variegata]
MKREVTWEFKEDAKRKHPYLSEQGRELKKAASLDHVGRQPVFDMTLDLFGGKDASYVTQVIWLSSKEGACKTLDDHSTLCLARTVMQDLMVKPHHERPFKNSRRQCANTLIYLKVERRECLQCGPKTPAVSSKKLYARLLMIILSFVMQGKFMPCIYVTTKQKRGAYTFSIH